MTLKTEPSLSARQAACERAAAWARANPERARENKRRSYLKLRPELKPVETALERFARLTMPVPESGCWLWLGGLDKDGYGKVKADGKTLRAHRWSWMLHRGETAGLHVLHKCDTPTCVNPDHLFLGTALDNMTDMWAKGRRGEMRGGSMPGIANPTAKFTDTQLEEMRAMKRRTGMTNKAIAKMFNISESHLSHVLNGRVRKV